ncbi:hypothetical protein Patl1_31392 [Pistacia atlantica]|uniref:Uncharacterized protein n=1 Tax=Pistacia atlantica TaxID=434234 RepID=A0ACC1ALW3_9ROSI|nr:hypothetical protein Patl1_31392 [Pistacia atlantica]
MRNLLSWFFLIIFFASCFSHVVLVSGQCQSDQQSLLLQLKNSLVFNSTSSVKLAQWDQNTDCCNWSGVDCDEAGHVIGLNLSNESISDGIENAAGQVPSSISGMTKLVTLDLSSLTFLGSSVLKLENPNLSTFLQNFTEIRELYLDGVNISAHGNEWCKALSSSLHNLQVLSLSNCFLSGPISTSLAELRSLSVVRLDQNNLSSTVPGFLAEFMNLTSLRLSYCGLLGTFPEKFFQVPTLENLDLSNNELLQVIGIGFGIGSAVVVAPLMFSDKVNQWIEAEEDLEGKKSDEDDDDYDETETQEFRGRYCVFCSKLDFTRKRVVHDLKCTCHDSPPPISSSTSTASSSSSLAHFDQS